MSRFELSRGFIQRLATNDKSLLPCVFQCLDVKQLRAGNSSGRWRVVLSDGQNFIQGMLSNQVEGVAASNELQKNSVVRLTDYMCNKVRGLAVCVVLGIQVLGQCDQIGKPDPIPNQGAAAGGSQQVSSSSAQDTRPARNVGGTFAARGNVAGAHGGTAENFQPVSSLNPYQTGWRIKVRCTAKDPIRHYNNARGPGKVFSVDLLDKQGGEIRCTMFNDAVDKFYNLFDKDRVYIISRGSIKISRKQFTHIKNDYAITLDARSEVTPVSDDDKSIQKMRYNFVQLSAIINVQPGEFVDVIGVVDNVGELGTVRSKTTQREIPKRNIVIADKSARIDVTLWDSLAQNNDESVLKGGTIIALKGCKVSDFGGRSLSSGATVELWPERDEARDLTQWYQSVGGDLASVSKITARVDSRTPRMCIDDMEFQGLGKSEEKRDYFTLKGTITAISHSQERPPWYLAAPTEETKAKVIEDGRGGYFCSANNKTYTSYIPRYILRFAVNDFSGNLWVNAFNDTAEAVLGVKAAEAEKYLREGDNQRYEQIFREACFKTKIFKIGARTQYYMDEPRVRYEVMGVSEVDVDSEMKFLEEEMRGLEQDFPDV